MKNALSSLCFIFIIFALNGQYRFDFNTDCEAQLIETELISVTDKGLSVQTGDFNYYRYALPFYLPAFQQKKPNTYSFAVEFQNLKEGSRFSGLAFFMGDGHEFRLLFNTAGSHYLSLRKNSDKKFDELIPWGSCKHLNKGVNATNTIGMKVTKKSFILTINDQPIHVIKKKDLIHRGAYPSAGLGLIQLYFEKDVNVLIKGIDFSQEPQLRKIKMATFNQELIAFGEDVNDADFNKTSPLISADERTIFYVKKEDYDRVYQIKKNDDLEWGETVKLANPINLDDKNRSITSTNTDATSIYTKGYYKNWNYSGGGITKYTINDKGEWKESGYHSINEYKNINRYQTMFLSNDGKYLMSCIDMGNGHGNQDIHVSFLQNDGSFSKPLNLGSTINSSATESYAFLAPDNVTLYFSTEGLPGYGSNDIYMSKRLDDTWKNWSEPTNLGKGINSIAWEGYFSTSASGNVGLLCSSQDSKKISLLYFELEKEVKPDPVVIVSGTVKDQDTKEPIQTNVIFNSLNSDTKKEVTTNPTNGKYSLVLLKGEKYEIIAQKEGYYPISAFIDLTELESFAEVEKNLELAKIKIGQVVRLNNIFFDFGKATLLEQSFKELDRLVDLMQKNPDMRIELSGHTDAVGSAESNLSLSQQRAESVVNYVTSKGIATDRLIAKGYGKSKPVADNETEEGRALNRRVEFEIIK